MKIVDTRQPPIPILRVVLCSFCVSDPASLTNCVGDEPYPIQGAGLREFSEGLTGPTIATQILGIE